MATEIERKFLVNPELWKKEKPEKSKTIRQGYLLTTPDKTIRVRTVGKQGFITIKGKTEGFSRSEFEYEIPVKDANELIDHFAEGIVEKTRHEVRFKDKLWEVDEFKGENEGLLMAEIELDTTEASFEKPAWIADEVSHDARYFNANLAKHPFKCWYSRS